MKDTYHGVEVLDVHPICLTGIVRRHFCCTRGLGTNFRGLGSNCWRLGTSGLGTNLPIVVVVPHGHPMASCREILLCWVLIFDVVVESVESICSIFGCCRSVTVRLVFVVVVVVVVVVVIVVIVVLVVLVVIVVIVVGVVFLVVTVDFQSIIAILPRRS